MDCMEFMKSVPNKHYDLAIVDPPYGIDQDGSNNYTRSKLATSKNYKAYCSTDNNSPDKLYFDELFRISKNQIIWGANHFISKIPYDSSCWVVWDKNNGETDFADCELSWTSFNSAVRKYKFTWQGMLQEDMKNKQIRIHPNEKPVQLYKWLLKNYAKEGDKILDTHGGSGSIMLACHDMKFDLDWIELDPYYYKAALKRFKDHKLQLKLL